MTRGRLLLLLCFVVHDANGFIGQYYPHTAASAPAVGTSNKRILLPLVRSNNNRSRKLLAQNNGNHKKNPKPRFSQQAHAQQQNQKNQRNTNSPSPKQPWNSEKSIEELESIMMKRWGTMDNPKQTISETDLQRRRPVYDPWAESSSSSSSPSEQEEQEEKSTSQKLKSSPNFQEFYDEDDEGYEYLELEEKGGDLDDEMAQVPSKRMKVGHLISPKPVGGKGTNAQQPTSPAVNNNNKSTYFFNPNKINTVTNSLDRSLQQQKQQNESKIKNMKQQEEKEYSKETFKTNLDDKQSKYETSPPAPPQAKPLLDENGNPVLLTIDEALYRFQSTIDEDTIEVMDTAEIPIIACTKAQSWKDVGITSPVLLNNLVEYMNCRTPLAVQENACPAVLTGNDVLIGTYTGSGKTLAFLTPLVQQLLWSIEQEQQHHQGDDPGLAILIVAPGRELASQIVSVARDLLQGTNLSVQMAIGGTTFARNLEQIRKRKPNILVGTPGRIAELVVGKPGEKSGRLKLGSIQALVLDEFDALLEYKAHRDPTRAIMETLKRRHGDALQSILCSATASDMMGSSKVLDFLRPGFATAMTQKDDILVTESNNASGKNNKSVTQVSRTVLHGVVHVPHPRFGLETLRRILHTEPIPQQILIFVENARKVDIVVEKLGKMGIVAAPLHGGRGSEKMDRADVSKALREGYVGIVVATELAARGLDAPLLTHVINYDLPTDASHYAHRAGRCGRGGRPGVVINITKSPKERNVPRRFADSLRIEMHSVEPRAGKLIMLDPATAN